MLAAVAWEDSVLVVALRIAASEAGSSAVHCSAGPWAGQYRPAVRIHTVGYRQSVDFAAELAAGTGMAVVGHLSWRWDPSLMNWRSRLLMGKVYKN